MPGLCGGAVGGVRASRGFRVLRLLWVRLEQGKFVPMFWCAVWYGVWIGLQNSVKCLRYGASTDCPCVPHRVRDRT